MTRIDAFVPDLMDRSRFGNRANLVKLADLSASTADLVLVDLRPAEVLGSLPTGAGRVIGFAPHVDDELLAAASEAGCDEALPRSLFFRRLPELLAGDGVG
ncbi:MAG: hypothetical protein ACI8Y4_000439 [Candidatus Poriferisodalaceae bacterium]|jgi:hypothetical protein